MVATLGGLLQEYRIPLPLSVEEFRRGYRYANWKTNEQNLRLNRGGEVLSVTPYYHETYGAGTFTHTLYRLGSRLPAWVAKMAPASALVLDEKTWATYPYLRTTITIDVHTISVNGNVTETNALGLTEEDQLRRTVRVLDIVCGKVAKEDYSPDLDPTLVKSVKTGRGPFRPGWQEHVNPIMTTYKLVNASCKYVVVAAVVDAVVVFVLRQTRSEAALIATLCSYWGVSSKVEKLVAASMAEIAGLDACVTGVDDDQSLQMAGSETSIDSDEEDESPRFYEAEVEWGFEEEDLDSVAAADTAIDDESIPQSILSMAADKLSTSGRASYLCGICQADSRDTLASVFCVTCGEAFCDSCNQQWHNTPRLRSHKQQQQHNKGASGSATTPRKLVMNTAVSPAKGLSVQNSPVHRAALIEEVRRMHAGDIVDPTAPVDIQVAEAVLAMCDFNRPQNAPFYDAKQLHILNTLQQAVDGLAAARASELPELPVSDACEMSAELVRRMVELYRDVVDVVVRHNNSTQRSSRPDLYGTRGDKCLLWSEDVRSLYESCEEVTQLRTNIPAQLEHVKLTALSHNQKLCFWLNVYNALLMHACLVMGVPKTIIKRISLMKRAAYTIDKMTFSALDIEHAVLRGESHRPVLAGLLPVHRFRPKDPRTVAMLERPEPLVSFALATAAVSGPLLRVYQAASIREELETATREYLLAAVGFQHKKIILPKVLGWYARDFSHDARSLLEWVASKLPAEGNEMLMRRVAACGKRPSRSYASATYDWNFRYLIGGDIRAETPATL
eukprot:jgi/Chlat1/8239/Chrsp77S07688